MLLHHAEDLDIAGVVILIPRLFIGVARDRRVNNVLCEALAGKGRFLVIMESDIRYRPTVGRGIVTTGGSVARATRASGSG